MFTCMDITVAPGVKVAGGLFSGPIHFFPSGINMRIGWASSKCEDMRGSAEVNQSMGSRQIPALINTLGRVGSV